MNLPQIETGISLRQSYIFAAMVCFYLHLQTMFLLLVLLQKIDRFEIVLCATVPHAMNEEQEEYWDWLPPTSFVPGFLNARQSRYMARRPSFLGAAIISLSLLISIDLSFMQFQSLWTTTLRLTCLPG